MAQTRIDLGRRTPVRRLADSVFPLGLLPFDPNSPPQIQPTDNLKEDLKSILLRIAGSALYVGDRRVLTTRSGLEALNRKRANPYLLLTDFREGQFAQYVWPIVAAAPHGSMASIGGPSQVDAALLLTAPLPEGLPEVKPAPLGDSDGIGMGDQVVVLGYPLGTDLFLEHRFGRGIVQPTAYAATVGTVVPAVGAEQTPLFRLTVPGIGGLAGGAVCDAKNGTVLGIVTSTIHSGRLPQPVVYATPINYLKSFLKLARFQENASK